MPSCPLCYIEPDADTRASSQQIAAFLSSVAFFLFDSENSPTSMRTQTTGFIKKIRKMPKKSIVNAEVNPDTTLARIVDLPEGH